MATNKPGAAGNDGKKEVEEGLLWGGRFTGQNDPLMVKFNASISFDKRMWRQDITGSKAYVGALLKRGILPQSEVDVILPGLDKVAEEWESEQFLIQPTDEDIHSANERRLSEIIGADLAGKIHTGRSRNDQVTTDMKLWLRDALEVIKKHLLHLISVSVERADKEMDILLPGYTHLQPAQAVRWSHWLLCYATSLQRDFTRLSQLDHQVGTMTLGSGALAGNALGVDRESLAADLRFTSVSSNSLDSTMDRDFVCDFLYAVSMTLIHMSRWAEDLIIYSSKEFGLIRLADAYSTGSSLMPQKKNADSLELIRGKAGSVYGKLCGFLMSYKGIPSTYNKDLQEDKVAMFESYDLLCELLQIATGVLSTLTIDPARCQQALSPDLLATDLAYYLVRKKNVPFRQAHSLSGKCVAAAEKKGCQLNELTLEDLKAVSDLFDADVMSVWNYENSVEQYTSTGGTAKSAVFTQIAVLRKYIGEHLK